jgi:hypothetical protein
VFEEAENGKGKMEIGALLRGFFVLRRQLR